MATGSEGVMTETVENPFETKIAAPSVKRRGRPRTRITPAVREAPRETPVRQTGLKLTAKVNWDDISDASDDHVDQFHIPRSEIPDGYTFQWVTTSVYGKEEPQYRGVMERGGWTPVHHNDLDGRFDGRWGKKGQTGEINNGGQVLMIRPMELTIKARERDRRNANAPLQMKEAQMRGGLDVPGGSDPAAINANRISRTREPTVARIEVPED